MRHPNVPETLEGWSLLHQMFRIRWEPWRALPAGRRAEIALEAETTLGVMEADADGPSALVSLLGHKGDLMLIHFRRDFEGLQAAELKLAQTGLHAYLEPTTSYVSIVELGLYDMTAKIHEEMASRGLKRGTPEFDLAFDAEMLKQRERMMGRLYTPVPPGRYVCFYPMDKRRGEQANWYTVPFEKRAAMMREHGFIGREYTGQVTQIVSGSIGLDDWEWGVDLFAEDPLVFKKLIYDMRFDEASALYALFGPFYVGLRFPARELPRLLEGQVPALVDSHRTAR
ncbi:MAG TPA: hydrogen peroxide-dependent heme synthase [Candidatus Polarisedimenticolia bacterium]|jgi:chlorite dismutase|nr:hydrogen peroxide-dependent heme synthase [Candidatus Polarisedimenticolia bacterium]